MQIPSPARPLMHLKFLKLLEGTSRTFLLPILRLPSDLRRAVAEAYLCLRAIDEIEDHPELDPAVKGRLLRGIARIVERTDAEFDAESLNRLLADHADQLPEVTLTLPEFARLGPPEVQPLIWRSTAEMADRMAWWVEHNWLVESEADLDTYTFDVAGRVGLLLSDLWQRYDGHVSRTEEAIGFGRALQTVNIVRNREEDLSRGVDFFPQGWDRDRMIGYARRQLELADAYMIPLKAGAIREFCAIPLELARATLEAIEAGREKLTRPEVEEVVSAIGPASGEQS